MRGVRLRAPLRPGFRGTLLVLALGGTGSVALAAGAGSPSLERLANLALPDEVATASDVRWQDDGALLLGVGGNGVYSWKLGDERAELSVTLAGSRVVGSGQVQNYARLGGASSGAIAFSSGVFGVFRHDRRGISASKAVEIVGDIDRRHGRTAVVGLSRTPDGVWEDRLAWLIADDGTVRGILPKRSEDSYWFLAGRLGVIRVLSEDRVLVVPGLEPGVFIYDWSGRLRDTLGNGALFADSPWRITPEQRPLLTEPHWFRAWLSRHRVIDEVVADGRGNIFFFVRYVPTDLPYPARVASDHGIRVTGGGTVVDSSGKVTPVTMSSEQAAKMLELLEKADDIDTTSGEPIRIKDGGLRRDLARLIAVPPTQPQRTRVCWDLVHVRLDDLRTAAKAECVVDSELADARLRADLRGARAVVLLRGDIEGAASQVWRSEAFEARLVPPSY